MSSKPSVTTWGREAKSRRDLEPHLSSRCDVRRVSAISVTDRGKRNRIDPLGVDSTPHRIGVHTTRHCCELPYNSSRSSFPSLYSIPVSALVALRQPSLFQMSDLYLFSFAGQNSKVPVFQLHALCALLVITAMSSEVGCGLRNSLSKPPPSFISRPGLEITTRYAPCLMPRKSLELVGGCLGHEDFHLENSRRPRDRVSRD